MANIRSIIIIQANKLSKDKRQNDYYHNIYWCLIVSKLQLQIIIINSEYQFKLVNAT